MQLKKYYKRMMRRMWNRASLEERKEMMDLYGPIEKKKKEKEKRERVKKEEE